MTIKNEYDNTKVRMTKKDDNHFIFMFLFINTSNHKFIFLALVNSQGKILVYKKIKAEYQQSEKLLSGIEKIVGFKTSKDVLNGRDLPKLKGIIAVSGPGGFTSLRIGLATANALAWALQIPIVGVEWKISKEDTIELQDKQLINLGLNKIKKIKKFKLVLPKYGREPNITLKK